VEVAEYYELSWHGNVESREGIYGFARNSTLVNSATAAHNTTLLYQWWARFCALLHRYPVLGGGWGRQQRGSCTRGVVEVGNCQAFIRRAGLSIIRSTVEPFKKMVQNHSMPSSRYRKQVFGW